MYKNYFLSLSKNASNFFPKTVKINQLQKRGAGHAKWQNVKKDKENSSKQKSDAHFRIQRQINAAVKQGGADPSTNYQLKFVIEEASKLKIPKASLEKALQAAQNTMGSEPFWVIYSGPKGLLVAFEVIFPNKNNQLAHATLSSKVRKLNLKMEAHSSNFCTEKGVIIADALKVDNSFDKAMEDAIEIGAEEVIETNDNTVLFECLPERLDGVHGQLAKKNYVVHSAMTELEFNNYVQISEEEKKSLEDFISILQETVPQVLRASFNVKE